MENHKIYNEDQKRTIGLNMIKHGGSFVKYLGEALLRADWENSQKIFVAFPEYCEKYLKL